MFYLNPHLLHRYAHRFVSFFASFCCFCVAIRRCKFNCEHLISIHLSCGFLPTTNLLLLLLLISSLWLRVKVSQNVCILRVVYFSYFLSRFSDLTLSFFVCLILCILTWKALYTPFR